MSFNSSFPPDLQNLGVQGRTLRNAQLFELEFVCALGKGVYGQLI